MKCLVVGAGGFVGRALLRRLAAAGDEVVAVDSRLPDRDIRPLADCIEADICDRDALERLFTSSYDVIAHLAAVPGGAAEADPAASRRVNLDATHNLLDLAARQKKPARFVFASTIAVLGDALPRAGVDDNTPPRPRMIYGMHKAMMETAVLAMSLRGAVDGISLRLPGVVARPPGPSGMKSAFMSNVFHALRAGEGCELPVSAAAQMWMMSVARCAWNVEHAIKFDSAKAPASRVMTLPALRVEMAALVAAIADATGADVSGVVYRPDAAVETAFGAYPPLATPAADRAGFAHDGDVKTLVRNALNEIERGL